MHMDAQWIRRQCLDLPGVTEDLKWEKDLCFLVAGRMFCVLVLDGPSRVSLKVDADARDGLLDPPDIIPAPYLARHNWVQVCRMDRLSREQWQAMIARSHALVVATLPARLRQELE